ncbi:P-loop NTPase fold protein [Quadrisphaera setariae]|uniref:KAP NTPase domain-containing protein n=1 Tax=Quadrisphaera setariae TaxID=2593304 RepID=A0A5C8ZLE0_9ACTN|nr:P-loop NTPase fold protein [Quadrisphaera setariae]TXR57991.1 hypothetical protein FMM08_01860 [Quadrisphaera setariae]
MGRTTPAEGRAHVWADAPVLHQAADALHRGPFTSSAATLLNEVLTSSESVVAALVGPWGSGKSSTLGFILEELDVEHVVVRINPWMVSGPDGVAEEVVAAVTTALTAAGVAPAVASAARGYFAAAVRAVVKGAAAVGGAYVSQQGFLGGEELGSAAGGVVAALVDTNEDRATASESRPATLQQAAESLSTHLAEHARGVLVVIDDVDRLQPAEVLGLFKAVRLLGRLPYVHYLLAYDEETLLDLLTQTPVAHHRRDRALAYLEKMVPLRLEQPEVTEDQVDDLLAGGWASTSARCGPFTTTDDDAFTHEAEVLLRHVLTTPRVIHRFFAQLDLLLTLVRPHTVDVTDVAVLTVLRLHHPQVYRSLSNERRLLTAENPPDTSPDAQRRIEVMLRRPSSVLAGDWQPVVDAVHRLFPRTAGQKDATAFSRLAATPRRNRAQDPDYVDRYFALSPLEGDVGAISVRGALDAIAEGRSTLPADEFLDVLLAPGIDRRAVLAARRLLRRSAEHIATASLSPEAACALAVTFCRIAPYPRVASDDSEQHAIVLVGELLARVGSSAEPAWSDVVEALSDDQPLHPGHRPSTGAALWLLAQACSRGVPVVRQTSVQGLWSHLVDACWQHLVDCSLQLIDDAPPDGLGPWLVGLSEPSDLERQLGRAAVGRADLVRLVSMLLPLRPSGTVGDDGAVISDGSEALVAAVLDAAVGAVGEEGIRTAASTAPTGGGWAATRRRASSRLLAGRVALTRPSRPTGALTPSSLAGATRHEDVARGASEAVDVRVVVTVAAPAAPLPFAELGDAPEALGTLRWVDHWEDDVKRAVRASPAAAWLLAGLSGTAGADGTPGWDERSSRGHWIALSRLEAVREHDPGSIPIGAPGATDDGQRQVFVQVMPGTVVSSGSEEPTVGCSVVISLGLRLPRISRTEQISEGHQVRHRVMEPVFLEDLAAAVLAAVRSADLALTSRGSVPGAALDLTVPNRSAVVHIALICSDDIAAVVELNLPHRQTTSGATQFRWSAETTDVRALRSGDVGGPAFLFTAELLARWLRDAEYRRGVDAAVDAAVQAAARQSASA